MVIITGHAEVDGDVRHRRPRAAAPSTRTSRANHPRHKACGLAKLPFDAARHNDAWMHLCFAATDLLAWTRRISLDGPLRQATPKTLRYRLLHVAARVSHRRLQLDTYWPWTPTLHDAITKIQTRLQPLTVTISAATHPGL